MSIRHLASCVVHSNSASFIHTRRFSGAAVRDPGWFCVRTGSEPTTGWSHGVRVCATFVPLLLLFLTFGAAAQEPHGAPLGLESVIRKALATNPAIQLQSQQVELARGILQQSSGSFDSSLQFSVRHQQDKQPLATVNRPPSPIAAIETDVQSVAVGVDKTLRNGVALSMSLSSTRSDGTTNALNRWPPPYRGLVSFSMSIPLMRNTGRSLALGEAANDKAWQASREELRQAVARNVLSVVSAYWNVLAAQKSLEISREGETTTLRLLEDTQKLVAADELPAADLNLIRASLADRRSARIASETSLLQAHQSLGSLMGLPYSEITALRVEGNFPAIPQDIPNLVGVSPAAQERALMRRPELSAARLRQDSAKAQVESIRANLKSQLDLVIGIGTAGIVEGGSVSSYYQSLSSNTARPNSSVALVYQRSFGNNFYDGLMVQRVAAYELAAINYSNLVRSIGLAVESSYLALVSSARQLEASMESVTVYEISLENERTKNRLGTSTLLNVLNVSDSLRNARFARVSNYLNYVNALATFAFESGVLIEDASVAQVVDLSKLMDSTWAISVAR